MTFPFTLLLLLLISQSQSDLCSDQPLRQALSTPPSQRSSQLSTAISIIITSCTAQQALRYSLIYHRQALDDGIKEKFTLDDINVVHNGDRSLIELCQWVAAFF